MENKGKDISLSESRGKTASEKYKKWKRRGLKPWMNSEIWRGKQRDSKPHTFLVVKVTGEKGGGGGETNCLDEFNFLLGSSGLEK